MGHRIMDNPAARSLLETVRQINEIGRRARSGEPAAEDYLRAIASDPVTEWFTGLLREKSEELERERRRVDQLTCALRAWYMARGTLSNGPASEAESQLRNVIHAMGIIEP
jgi:hypothetical protein